MFPYFCITILCTLLQVVVASSGTISRVPSYWHSLWRRQSLVSRQDGFNQSGSSSDTSSQKSRIQSASDSPDPLRTSSVGETSAGPTVASSITDAQPDPSSSFAVDASTMSSSSQESPLPVSTPSSSVSSSSLSSAASSTSPASRDVQSSGPSESSLLSSVSQSSPRPADSVLPSSSFVSSPAISPSSSAFSPSPKSTTAPRSTSVSGRVSTHTSLDHSSATSSIILGSSQDGYSVLSTLSPRTTSAETRSEWTSTIAVLVTPVSGGPESTMYTTVVYTASPTSSLEHASLQNGSQNQAGLSMHQKQVVIGVVCGIGGAAILGAILIAIAKIKGWRLFKKGPKRSRVGSLDVGSEKDESRPFGSMASKSGYQYVRSGPATNF